MPQRSFLDYLRTGLVIPLIFVIFVLATGYLMFLTLITLGQRQGLLTRHVGKIFGRTILMLLGVDLEIFGKPSMEPAIYFINHSSTLDLFIIVSLGLPDVRFIAKKELQYNPFFFVMGHLTGQIFVDRGNSIKAVTQLKKAYERITTNRFSILVAPEGSRSHEDKIGKFKKGGFHSAIALNYPIRPIYISGADDLARGKQLVNKSGCVRVYFKEEISTSGWEVEKIDQYIQQVRELYIEWSKKHPGD